MQKTEKDCKNQCFCYHKTTKISPKTGPKTQKSASGPGHLRNRKKRCCKPKNWGQKVEKHGFFSLFACRFWTGAFTNRCLPYCFLQCFLKASVTTYQKQEVLAEKWPPPPGKPVTFYECHPEDHAPAPSVRADFYMLFYMFHYVSIHFSFQLSTSKLQPQTTEEWLGVLEGWRSPSPEMPKQAVASGGHARVQDWQNLHAHCTIKTFRQVLWSSFIMFHLVSVTSLWCPMHILCLSLARLNFQSPSPQPGRVSAMSLALQRLQTHHPHRAQWSSQCAILHHWLLLVSETWTHVVVEFVENVMNIFRQDIAWNDNMTVEVAVYGQRD